MELFDRVDQESFQEPVDWDAGRLDVLPRPPGLNRIVSFYVDCGTSKGFIIGLAMVPRSNVMEPSSWARMRSRSIFRPAGSYLPYLPCSRLIAPERSPLFPGLCDGGQG